MAKRFKKEQIKKGVILKEEIVQAYDWRITPFKNPDGSILFYLTRLFKGKFVGTIICNKRQLKDLKKFMAERKFS